ncbi:MAG: GNAT family N-acetyltransferase [Actinomycetia bacterium]|nr:GNAT family N-acetyltransferase [Actinomycetes bacterium]
MPIVDAVDWVADEARSRGQIARFQLSDHLLHDAERRWLTEMGIGGIDSTLVMVARQALDRFDPAVDVADRVDAPWHNRWHDVSGASVAPQISAGFMAGLGGVKAASVGPIDRPSCVGLGLETELGSYLCAIATDPSLRGRGMATRLVAHLMTIMPAPFVLNVVPSNPAVRIYERLGFSAVHSYRYHELG